MDRIMSGPINLDVTHDELCELYANFMEHTGGPYRLDMALIGRLIVDNYSFVPRALYLSRHWCLLVKEFCPVWMLIPDGTPVPEVIEQIDVRTDYIYATGYLIGAIDNILCLSNEILAYMLRVSYGFPIYRTSPPVAMLPYSFDLA